LTLDADKAVTAGFDPRPTTQPVIDANVEEPPAEMTVATANPNDRTVVAELATGVTGNGVVTEEAGSSYRAYRTGGSRIACGFNEFHCYARVDPGQRVVLVARPLRSYRFVAWTGACAGQGARCQLVARDLQTVTAIFAPKNAAASVGFAVRRLGVQVHWNRSIGQGQVVVSGRIGGSSRLVVRLRRPTGGPLLTRRWTVGAGTFRRQFPLRRNAFPGGAKVLPGGFVVSAVGTSRGFSLPFQLRPIVIPAPAEGVVRQAYASAVETGPPTGRLPRGVTEAWVHFRLATQPASTLPITVAWYRPSGKLMGTKAKADRPEIVSGISWTKPIPHGSWTAELRAGLKVVKRATVRIG
jgi:hypothetical protein